MFISLQYVSAYKESPAGKPQSCVRIVETPRNAGLARALTGRLLWMLAVSATLALSGGLAAAAETTPSGQPFAVDNLHSGGSDFQKTASWSGCKTTVTISASESQITEGGSAVFVVTSSRRARWSRRIYVNVNQSGDFLDATPPSTVTMPTLQNSATFTVDTIDDQIAESAGMLTATLTSGKGYSVGDPNSAVVKIKDNDQTPPRPNQPASGAPDVLGSAYVGQILTAGTIRIRDENGLNDVTWRYQWFRGSDDIAEATESSYTIVADDLGNNMKVQVDFTDDAGYEERLTSGSTRNVTEAAPGLPEVSMVRVLPERPQAGEVLTIAVQIDSPIPVGASNITGGVLIWDTGNPNGVQLHAFLFSPGDTEVRASNYSIPDGGNTTDRRIQVTLNPAFDEFYRIGQPSAMTVSVQSPQVAPKLAMPESRAADSLGANYPNPFNSATWIPYRLGSAGDVHLDIYNLLGQRIRTLVNKVQAVGTYRIRWDGLSQAGAEVASGVYIARLRHAGVVQLQRLLYVK